MRRLVHTLLVLATSTLVACDETPTAPTQPELSGRWVVSALEPAGAASITPRPGVELALEFADERIAVQSDCNVCSGRYTLSGGSLTLSPLACTRRACLQDSYEGTFLDLLSSIDTARIVSGEVLIVAGQAGRIRLRRH